MNNRRKVPDHIVLEAYQRLGNVHKVAREIGLNHSSVHERLVRLGVPRKHPPFSEAEKQRLLREYVIYRDAGKLDQLAREMGRTRQFLCRKARELGLTDPRHKRPYLAVWAYMSESAARVLFDDFKRTPGTVKQFCTRRGLDELGFSRTMKRFFPDEWDVVVESKAPRQSLYRYGRQFEYRTRDDLRKRGYFVLRSPRSNSPVDLVAIRKGIMLFIQCKRSGQLPPVEWNAVFDLAESVGAVPVLAESPSGRGVTYWRLKRRKDGTRKRQPMEPFEP